jgi:transposase
MEATSRYGEALAEFLHAQGLTVSVVNPHSTHHFAQSQHRHTKTDLSDAQLLAHYAAVLQPRAWQPPSPQARQLQELVRHLDSLQRAHTAIVNRLKAHPYRSAFVEADLKAQEADLAARIAKTRQQMQQHVEQHPDLRQQRDLLVTIPGIAEDTATRLLGEVLDFKRFDSGAALAAFAGLCPRLFQSGTSVHKRSRLSKRGNSALRWILYYPALSALQHNPGCRNLRQRMLASGHSKKACVGAVMHKLLVMAYGVLQSEQPFDPHWRARPA